MSILTTESRATNFKHAAISAPNTIRVLILHPGKGNDPLKCSFREHTLLSAQDLTALNWTRNSPGVGSYQAISYSWHDDDCQNQPDHIYCDEKPIQITKNVTNILYQLRSVSPQELWIDQLCINQNDDTEKATQIPLMGKLYGQAAVVTLWLGEPKEDTHLGLDLARKLQQLDIETSKELPVPSTIRQSTELAELGLPNLQSGQWWPLMELFSRRVLQRLWIVQEIIMASCIIVRCGIHTIDFESLRAAAKFIQKCQWTTALQIGYREHYQRAAGIILAMDQLPQIDHLEKLGQRRGKIVHGEAVSMEQLLMDTRSCKGSDDYRQDRIFALLGVYAHVSSHPDSELPPALSASYAKFPEEVYYESTKHLLCNGSLDILSVIEDGTIRPTNNNLPSWVPNFHVNQETEVIGDPTTSISLLYSADGNTWREVAFSRISRSFSDTTFCAGGEYVPPTWPEEEPDIMRLNGYKIDDIALISSPCHDPLSQTDSIKGVVRVEDWFSEYYPDALSQAEFLNSCAATHDWFSQEYPNGQSSVDAFWRTLITDTGNRYINPAPIELAKSFFGLCLESMALLKARHEMKKLKDEGYVVQESDSGTIPPELEKRLWEEALSPLEENSQWERNIVLAVYMRETGINIPISIPKLGNKETYAWAPGLFWVFSALLPAALDRDWLKGADGSLYKGNLRKWCWHRRFFSTKDHKGYFGIGPRSSQWKDEVFILQGARVPFILRKTEGEKFKIVGEAYIHGMMHGEALRREGFEWKEIRIQ